MLQKLSPSTDRRRGKEGAIEFNIDRGKGGTIDINIDATGVATQLLDALITFINQFKDI